MNRFSIVIILYNAEEVIERCLRSVIDHTSDTEREVILIDNASPDRSAEIASKILPNVRLIRTPNRGFGHANNVGAAHAQHEYLFFLNADAYFVEPILSRIAGRFGRDRAIAAVGPMLEYPDGRFQLSAGSEATFMHEFRDRQLYRSETRRNEEFREAARRSGERAMGFLTGAALCVSADAFRSIGGFDEGFFLYFEDKDICVRLRREGYRCLYDPHVVLRHEKNGSAGRELSDAMRKAYRHSQRYYYSKHRPLYERWMLAIYHAMSS